MKIRIISVGRLKQDELRGVSQDYLRRLSFFADVEILEVADEPTPDEPTTAQTQAVLKKEASRILPLLKGKWAVYALAIEGKMHDSLSFAQMISRHYEYSEDIAFVIGGSFGLSEELKKTTAGLVSFSRLTFPHRLTRILLLEQLFRAFKINANQTYHK